MQQGKRAWRWVLAVSLALNVLVIVGGVLYVGTKAAAQERPNYPALGRERFADLPGAKVVIVGDSQAQNGAWSELLNTPVANRGIGGQTVADTRSWIDLALGEPELRHLVVWAGTNDVLQGVDPATSKREMAELVARVHQCRPDVDVTAVAVPPMPGRERAVDATNAAISTVVETVDPSLRADLLEADGVHVSPRGYDVVAETLKPHVAG